MHIATHPGSHHDPAEAARCATVRWQRRSTPQIACWRIVNTLRTLRLRWRGAVVGGGFRIAGGSSVVGASGIRAGCNVQIGPRARIEVHLTEHGIGRLEVGNDVCILNDVHIGAAGSVSIGSGCGVAAGCLIIDHDHDFSDPLDWKSRNLRIVIAPVTLEDHVFLGERVAVLKGVRIGRGTVVGAHSVVTRDLPPFTMCAGIPARPIARYCPTSHQWKRIETVP